MALLNKMRLPLLITLLVESLPCRGQTLDTKEASNERFKVTFVEAADLPPLADISKKFFGREEVLDLDSRMAKAGVDAKELERERKDSLRFYYYPIRVTDLKTGNIYEVQKDRRTIIARTKDGKVLWEANPFVDAKLKPYRVDHPFINYFGRITGAVNPDQESKYLQVNFNSSQFGLIDLKNGSFRMRGQD